MHGGGEFIASVLGFALLALAVAAIGQRLHELIDAAFGRAIDHDFPAAHVRQRDDVQ
ncbi:MAG: hypothetical protein QOH04_2601 [Sphingomonadales bacterium]|jgi:hypothetical protein|nr:hypothetical protein [Sphingomonadales bacterium]